MKKEQAAKISALIIEEQPLTQSYIRHMLEDLGFMTIVIADNPRSALRAAKKQTFELVLCSFDFGSGKDGYHIFEELKLKKLLPSYSVFLFISAETTPEMVRSMLELEPDDFIVKPFNLVNLGSRLNRALQKKQRLKPILALIDDNKFSQALELIDQRLTQKKLQSEFPHLLRIKGEILLEQQRYDEAAFFYSTITKQQPFLWAKLGYIRCLIAHENIELALSELDQLTDAQSNLVTAFDIKGSIEFDQSRYADALATFKRAAAISPRNHSRQEMVADLSRLNHDYQSLYEARKCQLKYAKASIHETVEQYLNVARSAIDFALTEDDENTILRLNRLIGDHIREIEKLPQHSRYQAQLNTIKARQSYLKNDKEKALKHLRDASIEEENVDSEGLLDRAKAQHELGFHGQAMSTLKKLRDSLQHFPRTSPAFAPFLRQECQEREEIKFGLKELNNIAAQHFKNGNAPLAYAMFAQALTVMPKNTRVALNLMQVICERFNLNSLTIEQAETLDHCKSLLSRSTLTTEQSVRFSRLLENMRP